MNLKTALELLEIIDQQNTLIAQLVNESCEQEAIIEALMQDHVEDVPLSEQRQLIRNQFTKTKYLGMTVQLTEREVSCPLEGRWGEYKQA